jgi:hypothetical protein
MRPSQRGHTWEWCWYHEKVRNTDDGLGRAQHCANALFRSDGGFSVLTHLHNQTIAAVLGHFIARRLSTEYPLGHSQHVRREDHDGDEECLWRGGRVLCGVCDELLNELLIEWGDVRLR